MRTIKKTIHLHAPAEKVWEVLTDDELSRIWFAEFSEGSHATTDWKVGSLVKFTDNKESGLIARVTENGRPHRLAMEFMGVVENGKEILTGKSAELVRGGKEIYELRENNGVTTLDIKSDMEEDYFDQMNKLWDKALMKFKSLAEGEHKVLK